MDIPTHTPPRARSSVLARIRRGSTAGVFSLLLAVPVLTIVGPAQAMDPDKVGPTDHLQRGFPAYYTDDNGVTLQLCDDGSANCGLTRPGDLKPPNGEAFYYSATAELSSPGIDLTVDWAIEAAWAGRQQIVFDRLRIRGHVNQAGSYTVSHPYGTTTVQAESPSEDRNVNFTEDIGCAPLAGSRCKFKTAAGTRGHITSFLKSTSAPRRYMGNPDRLTTASGGLRQSVTVSGPAGSASTSKFGVMGKRAFANAVSLRNRQSFGNVRTHRRHIVRLRNIGTGPMKIRSVSLKGERTIHRFRTKNTCRHGDRLPVGGRCRVGIRYRPDGRRLSTATLVIKDDVKKRKIHIVARTAATFRARHRVHFTGRRAGTSSHTRRVVVSNTGALPMKIRSVAIRGRNASSFARRSGAPRVCAGGVRVPAHGTCAVYVAFAPGTFGTKRARIVLHTNALHTHRIRLRGRAS